MVACFLYNEEREAIKTIPCDNTVFTGMVRAPTSAKFKEQIGSYGESSSIK